MHLILALQIRAGTEDLASDCVDSIIGARVQRHLREIYVKLKEVNAVVS